MTFTIGFLIQLFVSFIGSICRIGHRLYIDLFVSRANFLTTCIHIWMLLVPTILKNKLVFGKVVNVVEKVMDFHACSSNKGCPSVPELGQKGPFMHQTLVLWSVLMVPLSINDVTSTSAMNFVHL